MNRRRLVCVFAAFAAASIAIAQTDAPFVFTKPDLRLLEECDALDRQLEKHALVLHDAALEKYLADLAAPMLPKSPLDRVEWRFHILRDPMVNAFAAPNGSIYVLSGLLARVENDDQLVAVLAHEITHTTDRHAYVFNRSLRKKFVAAEVLGGAAEVVGPAGLAGALIANLGDLTLIGMLYSYSRKLEEEADRTGFDRFKAAGHDSGQMVRVMQLLDKRLEPEPVPRLLWTHPRPKERIAYLKEKAGLTADPAPREDVQFLDRMRPVIQANIQLDLDSRRYRSAVAAAERLAAAHPNDATSLYWLGESYRALGPREPRLSEQEQTDAGMRSGYSKMRRRTEEEELIELTKTPEGAAALEHNQRKAEELFLKAASLDPTFADPHFGLGALNEAQGRPAQAIDAYTKFVELSTSPAARQRGQRRIEALKQKESK
jgi:predicted Zn-dependent protease